MPASDTCFVTVPIKEKATDRLSAWQARREVLGPECHSLLDKDTGHEAREFHQLLKPTQLGPGRFLFLLLHSREDSQSLSQAPAPGGAFGKTAFPGQSSEGKLQPDRALRREPKKPAAPPCFPRGTPRSPPGRAPPLILEDTGSATRGDKGPGLVYGRLCPHQVGDTFLSPDSRPRTFSFPVAATRSQPRLLPQRPLFCFRCEIAAS